MNLTELTQVQALLPDYTGGRYSVRYNTDKEIITEKSTNQKSPSGWRADVIEQQRVVTPAEYDEDGNITTQAVTKTVYDVRIPEWMQPTEEERIIAEVDKKIDSIADKIESGLRGKELADEIRKIKGKK